MHSKYIIMRRLQTGSAKSTCYSQLTNNPARKCGCASDRALPWLVLVAFLMITLQLWTNARQDEKHNLQTIFDSDAREIIGDLEQRMKIYEQVLRGTQGLFAASENITRNEFRTYVGTLRLEENFPGIQGLGFSLIVPPSQKDRHIAAIRRESMGEGIPEYNIHPAGKRDIYTSVIYIEPFSGRNLHAFGYDMYSDMEHPRDGDSAPGLRRAAMERARDSGRAAISGKIRLLMETSETKQAGFLMYLPVYKNGMPHDTIAERRSHIVGWVYAPFRVDDLMAGLIDEQNAGLDLEIYDGEEMSDKTVMHDSDYVPGIRHNERFQSIKRVNIAGRNWTVAIRSHPDFGAHEDSHKQQFVAIAGIGASLLLSLLTWLLVQGRERAMLAARKMNKELIGSEGRAKRIGLLYKMLSEMNSANIHIRERAQLLDKACRIVMESGLFRMVWIGLLDQKSGVVTPVSHAGYVEGYLDHLLINIHDGETGIGPTGTAVRNGVPVICDDIASDPRMQRWCEAALQRGYRASVTFPLTQSGQTIGAMTLYSRETGLLTEDIIHVLTGMVEDISFSLDFIAESQHREKVQEELQDLSLFLQSARENERAHIARELHDELGQSMTALRFDLKWLHENINVQEKHSHEKLQAMNDLVGRTVDSIRRISEDLRPGMLDDLGLAAAIENHVTKFSEQSGITCDLSMNQADFDLDSNVATAVFRIVQEALTNVARHSGASHVIIRLQELGDKMLLIVQDNGRGLPSTQDAHKKTYGLLGMRERVKMLGGTLDLFNEKGAGARIEVCVPKHVKGEP